MRVLTVGLLYPPHYLGGYELACQGTMQALVERGHEVRVLASDYRAPGVLQADELPVFRQLRSYMDPSAQRAAALTPPQRLRLERFNGAILERHLREFSPDVVSWWGMGGMSLSLIERVRRAGVPSVLMVQDRWPIYGMQTDSWTRMTRRLQPLAWLLEPLCGVPISYALERAGCFVFNSEHTRAACEAAGLRPPEATVVTPGVHARFLRAACAKEWEWRLLHVGRIDPDKGIDLAVAALALLPEQATLTIVGAGDPAYCEQLRRQAATLGVSERVRLLGSVPSASLLSHYEQADTVVFPIRWEEPWGLVPLEAMGVGRAVIATPRGGAASYLRDAHNALLIGPEDPEALAAAVRRLAEDPALRERLRQGGLQTAAEHTAARHDRRLVEEIERVARIAGT